MSKFEILLYAYAVVLLVGGFAGYAKAKSMPSLIAGVVSAALAAIAAYLVPAHLQIGAGLAAVVGIALTVVFFRRYQETKKPMPAMPIIVFSIIVFAAS